MSGSRAAFSHVLLGVGRRDVQPEERLRTLPAPAYPTGLDLIVRDLSDLTAAHGMTAGSSLPVCALTLEIHDGDDAAMIGEARRWIGTLQSPLAFVILAASVDVNETGIRRLEGWTAGIGGDGRVLFEPRAPMTAAGVLDVLDEIPGIGLSLSTEMLARTEYDVAHALMAATGYLEHLRLADANGWAPGLGPLEWQRIRRAMEECGKLAAISLDMVWRPNLEAALVSAERTLGGA